MSTKQNPAHRLTRRRHCLQVVGTCEPDGNIGARTALAGNAGSDVEQGRRVD
jgi:hypothetical protein